MDWNAIFNSISGYLGIGFSSVSVVAILAIAIKVAKVMKSLKSTFTDSNKQMIENFKKAIPPELWINVEAIATQKFDEIKKEFIAEIDKSFLEPIKANTELCKEIAKAMTTMKALPDSTKAEISKLLELEKPATTESLKVDLIAIPEEEPKATQKEILID